MSFQGLTRCVFALAISCIVLSGCNQNPAAMDTASTPPVKSAQGKTGLAQIQQPPARGIPQASAVLAADCAQDKYQQFFEDFVELVDARKDYVSHEVEMLDAAHPAHKLAAVPGERYEGFRIGIVDSRWVDTKIAATKLEDAPTLDVDVSRIDGQTFRVDYVKAIFDADDRLVRKYGKPGAFVFKHRDRCWMLAAEIIQ